jgi:hypothetical protein
LPQHINQDTDTLAPLFAAAYQDTDTLAPRTANATSDPHSVALVKSRTTNSHVNTKYRELNTEVAILI